MVRYLIAAVLSTALLSPGAAGARQSSPAAQPATPGTPGAPVSATATSAAVPDAVAAGAAPASAPSAGTTSPVAGATDAAAPGPPVHGTGARQREQDALEPAVDTSASSSAASAAARQAAPGKAMDHLELGTTDITGNRELPKVLYIVPWKHSDLGDLTGKPLNSLVDETLQPIDRDVFKRENRYYGAVAQKGSGAGASRAGAAADVSRNGDRARQSARGDER